MTGQLLEPQFLAKIRAVQPALTNAEGNILLEGSGACYTPWNIFPRLFFIINFNHSAKKLKVTVLRLSLAYGPAEDAARFKICSKGSIGNVS